MKHHCLQIHEVEETHTAKNLAEELQAVLKEWGLESKAFGCTTDNASNITNAIEDHMSLVHLPCIGHTLQLSIDQGLQVPSIARVLGRCKKLAQQDSQVNTSHLQSEGETEIFVWGSVFEADPVLPYKVGVYLPDVRANSVTVTSTVCSSSGPTT